MDILQSLNELIEKGFSKTDIEYLAEIPKNSLSSILSQKRRLSKKSELKLKRFLDSDIPDPLTFKKENIGSEKKILVQEKKETIHSIHKPIIKNASQQLDNKIKTKESLEKIIKAPPTKKYFNGRELPDYDPEIGHEGITNPNAPF